MGLDGVVEVVGDGGAVSQLQRHAVAVHQGAVEPRDHALDRKIDKLRDIDYRYYVVFDRDKQNTSVDKNDPLSVNLQRTASAVALFSQCHNQYFMN